MFEAAGLTRDEQKHSCLLAFLLNPKESHRLGDSVLTRILQEAVGRSKRTDLPVSALDLELWDLSDTEVLTEWSKIDILVLNRTNNLAVVIENKIDENTACGVASAGNVGGFLVIGAVVLVSDASGWRNIPDPQLTLLTLPSNVDNVVRADRYRVK